MKKLIILSGFMVLAAWVMSCRKEAVTRSGNSVTVEPPAPVESVKIVSEWFYLPMELVVNRGHFYLQGRHEFNSPVSYDKNNHVESWLM